MGDSGAYGRLTPALYGKIMSLPKATPWVWLLRLSKCDFSELEKCLKANRDSLATKELALPTIVYLGEWYKRRYASGSTEDALGLDSSTLESIWDLSGLNTDSFVYSDNQGHKRWLYSAYILGGLAINHELGRNDNGRFLKALCRIYHHEDYTLENLDDEARAISFRESIRRRHSLYFYLQAILSGEMPFAREELDDPTSLVRTFIRAVEQANEEVLRRKFRFEWIVTNAPGHSFMSRQLRLWLCPEEVGEGLHQYILYDRLRIWGINTPEALESFDVGLRFKNGSETVQDADFSHPLISFINTGARDTGFISLGVSTYVTAQNIPPARFDHVEVVIRDNLGIVYNTQPADEVGQFLQLWHTDALSERWSSRQDAQHATAVVFSQEWELIGITDTERKPFKRKDGGLSDPWCWVYIFDSITIRNRDNGKTITLYNRQGYDRVFTRLYNETIRYKEGGLVDFIAYDEDGEDESSRLPLIFSPDDIRVRHFATKDDILNAAPENDTDPENIEWKRETGRYEKWEDGCSPAFGIVNLRLTKKGAYLPFKAIYLPSIEPGEPIIRNFKDEEICYASYDDEQSISFPVFHDHIVRNGIPLKPTVTLEVGPDVGHAELEIWRPTLLNEVCIEGKVISYHYDDAVALPYILKYETVFREFSRKGFQEYDCSRLGNIYPNLGEVRDRHKEIWQQGLGIPAKELDETAPDSLMICFGIGKLPNECPVVFYHWDYLSEPIETEYATETDRNTIIFQSLQVIDSELTNVYPVINTFAFSWGRVRAQLSLLDCFEVAIKHRLHFFILQPFVNTSSDIFATDMYPALINKREGNLTQKDRIGLKRLSEEMGFTWDRFGIIV